MKTSIWKEEVQIEERMSLPGDCGAEVVVIGAGMAGILTAYFLKQEGKKVIVLEADRIGSGQTGNTTAKITSQHGAVYEKMIWQLGLAKARLYATANEEAIAKYEELVKKLKIDCEFQRLPAYLYSTNDEKTLKEEARAASLLGIRAHFMKESELPFKTAGMVCFENQAQFHPLKFLKRVAEEVTVYEQTKVLSVKKHEVRTNRGTVFARQIVFATHYPITNVPGFYFLREHQERSYVLALENAKMLNGMYYSIDKNGLSFRMKGDKLLLGGGGHRTGAGEKKLKESGYHFLKQQAEKLYPNAKEAARWSAQDCMSHDGLPFIGQYSKCRPYWYVASGFKKWGMTSAMISACILTDLICEKNNPYAKLFTPSRLLIRAGICEWIKDVGMSVKGLFLGAVHAPFSKKAHRCPHMGCELCENKIEGSYDCPCHGSRFDKDGRLIDNPAQVNVKKI